MKLPHSSTQWRHAHCRSHGESASALVLNQHFLNLFFPIPSPLLRMKSQETGYCLLCFQAVALGREGSLSHSIAQSQGHLHLKVGVALVVTKTTLQGPWDQSAEAFTRLKAPGPGLGLSRVGPLSSRESNTRSQGTAFPSPEKTNHQPSELHNMGHSLHGENHCGLLDLGTRIQGWGIQFNGRVSRVMD